MGQRAAFNEEAVDHRCANAGSAAHDAGPALTSNVFLSCVILQGRAHLILPGQRIVKCIFRLKHIFF